MRKIGRCMEKIMIISILMGVILFYAGNDALAAFGKWFWPFPASTGLNVTFADHDYQGVDVGVPVWSEIYSPTDGTLTAVFRGCDNHSALKFNSDGTVNNELTITCQEAGRCTSGNYSTHPDTYGFCNNGFGNGVVIYTDDGHTVQFAHMNQVADGLEAGQSVSKDTFLGYTGDTGNATGVHVHYAVSDGEDYWTNFIDPMSIDYLPRTGSPMASGNGQVLPDGDYIIHNAAYTGRPQVYYLDFDGAALPAANLTPAILTGAVNHDDINPFDVWTLEYLNNGFYKITQKGTNMGLNVHSVSLSSGTDVIANPYNGEENEQWSIAFNGSDGYSIQARHSSFYLDAGSMTNGSVIRQSAGNGTGTQSWLFVPYKPSQPVENGRYIIVSDLESNLQLDVPGDTGDIAENTEVTAWHINASSRYNAFDFTKLSNGYYSVIHHESGKALEMYGGVSTITKNLSLHTPNNRTPQYWAIFPNGNDTYSLVVQSSGYAMDLANAATENGSMIRQFPRNGSPAQTWHLVPAEHTVSYDANGGTGQPDDQIKYHQGPLTLSSTVPTKDGYMFIGWGLSADSQEPVYQPGDTYDQEADLALYAVWRSIVPPTEYVLTVNALLDQVAAASAEGYATFDVYIDGSLEAESVSSFGRSYPHNVQFEITNIQLKPGKRFDGVTSGMLKGDMPYGSANVTLAFTTVIDIGGEWGEVIPEIPEGLDLSDCEIEYQHTYRTVAQASPGSGWSQVPGSGVTSYEDTGDIWETEYQQQTSNTLVLVGRYYYHWCSAADWGNAEHHQVGNYTDRHVAGAIANFDVVDSHADYQDPSLTYYKLRHNTGTYAGQAALCDAGRTDYWYIMYQYQRRTAVTTYTWTKTEDWTSVLDSEAYSVQYRIRLKDTASPQISDLRVTSITPRGYTLSCAVSDDAGVVKVQFLSWTENETEANAAVQEIAVENTPKEAEVTAAVVISDHGNERDANYYTKVIVYDIRGNTTESVPDDATVYMPTLIRTPSRRLILPTSLQTIEDEAFEGSIAFAEVVLPEGVKRIGSRAFAECGRLTLIYMPDSIESIAANAFADSSNVVFLCASDNVAAAFARENQIPYFTGE